MALDTQAFVVVDANLLIVMSIEDDGLSVQQKNSIRDEWSDKFGAGYSYATIHTSQLTTFDAYADLLGLYITPNMPYIPSANAPSDRTASIDAAKVLERREEGHGLLVPAWHAAKIFVLEHTGENPKLSTEDDATWAGYTAGLADTAARFEMISKAYQLDSNLSDNAKHAVLKAEAQVPPDLFLLTRDTDTWGTARGSMKTTFYKRSDSPNAQGKYTAVTDNSIGMTGAYAGTWPSFEDWVLK